MLCYIYLSYALLIVSGQAIESSKPLTSTSVSKTVTSSSDASPHFETSHKIHRNVEFHTSHKITNERPIIKLLDDDIMQKQQTQNLLSTKERPELNPVLSALINEDVMKSIESKRAIEESEQPAVEEVTLSGANVLTTTQKPSKSADDIANEGLIDQSIVLDEAGSENNQKSRIQIKKGPNGVDYEYEYVYYYYDEDEKENKGGNKQKVTDSDSPKETTARGKSRYTNIDRSTTSAPGNEIISKARGRSSVPVSEDVDEGRLPQITRFPPRSRGGEPTAAPESEGVGSEKSRRISVKRPSLELVDSDTFNTDEKQVKSNRNIDSDVNSKKSSESENEDENGSEVSEGGEAKSTDSDQELENTTPLMEKVALDLYAILANENLNMDITTDNNEETTTDVPTTDAEELTTVLEEESTSTTTTTTTEATTTTTTTTTTTPAPLPGGRRGLSGGRNRFRLKNAGGSSTTTESAPSESGSAGSKFSPKSKGKFGRPSFGGGRTSRPSNKESEVKEESVAKEEAKTSSSSVRGRTRNRFNLRGAQASTTEKSIGEENSDSASVSTTARSIRRPQLNIRGRGRPGASTTASPETASADTEGKSTQATSAPARPSRFNLNRPSPVGGGNRLLPRGRLNLLKTTAAPAAEEVEGEEVSEKKEDDAAVADNETSSDAGNSKEDKSEASTQAATGLNRLRNRPKIQINTKTEKARAPAPAVNRKANPLLGRRRIGVSSTTEAVPADGGQNEDENDETKKEQEAGDSEPKQDASAEEPVQASSEPPRGLGLLGARRRLPLRKIEV